MRGLLPAYLVDAVRTPVGKYRGAFAQVRSDDLAATVIRALCERMPALGPRIDHVVFGATNQAGEDNRNVARMAGLLAGLPYEVPAVTVNRLCGSGLEAVSDAVMRIWTGDAEVVVAGGVENMTRAPFAMRKAEDAFDRRPPTIFDTTLGWRFENPRMAERFPLQSMGETAENVAEKWKITRDEQDAFAVDSQKKAGVAVASGAFDREIVKVTIPGKKGAAIVVDKDESPRPDTTVTALGALPAVFRKGGTVTAGNSSPLNDGASGVLVVSEAVLRAAKLTPLARVVAFATAGVEPNFMGEGPIPATKRALARTDWRVADLDLIELNEAFAAQAIACQRGLEIDPARLNLDGGAIALGHPIGSSGCRILVTLAHSLARREKRRGLAALCIGVGQGIAMLLERA
jgi:acetyl-CoA acyltransferase